MENEGFFKSSKQHGYLTGVLRNCRIFSGLSTDSLEICGQIFVRFRRDFSWICFLCVWIFAGRWKIEVFLCIAAVVSHISLSLSRHPTHVVYFSIPFTSSRVDPSRTRHIINVLRLAFFAGKRASIESMSANLTVKEGKRARIVCKVDGEPAPKVTWFKDGRSINRNRTKYIFVHLR